MSKPDISPERIAELSCKIEHFVELELGVRLPFVCLLADFDGHLSFFTNRASNKELEAMLQEAMNALHGKGDMFVSLDGELL